MLGNNETEIIGEDSKGKALLFGEDLLDEETYLLVTF